MALASLSSDNSTSPPVNNRSQSSRRLINELVQLERNPLPNCHAYPSNENILHWSVVFDGMKDTLYEGGTFFLELNFGVNYPFDPPEVRFMTRIYHCNINSDGEIFSTMKKNWKPIKGIAIILQDIISLFYACDPYNPMVPALAEQFLHQPEEYKKMARIWTQRYAT